MGRKSKRVREMAKQLDPLKVYAVEEAVDTLQKSPPVKFDQSVEISLKLGVDPRKSDQQVRSTMSLPNGTGKTTVVLVIAKGDKVQEALDAGADYAGEDYIAKIKSGWTDFDSVIATPDMMREVGKLGKVLGPRGLMPTPKAETVTTDVALAVKKIKAGQIAFKLDRKAMINSMVGKLSFNADNLVENIKAFIDAVLKARPASAKGQYIRSASLSCTMGPGLKLDLKELAGI